MAAEWDSWEEINWYVSRLVNGTSPVIRDKIYQSSISSAFIDGLIHKGWRVEYEQDHFFAGSISLPPETKITLRDNLTPYGRDKTLFHELAHLRHPVLLSSRSGPLKTPFGKDDIETIVEWLGRKVRADPELLRYAIVSFGLQPQVYDQASYAAFRLVKEQLSFPFAEDNYLERFPLFMD